MKVIFFSLLLVSLLLSSTSPTDAIAPASAPTPGGSCDAMCNARCGKAGIYKRCFKYCCLCCEKCKCVPSGTYGNKSECPCYRDLLNSKGQSKCP